MMINHLPYTKKALEDLAAAMNINTALLWVDPVTNQLNLKTKVVNDGGSDKEGTIESESEVA